MSNNVYLSPAKLLLLVAIEQYSLHYSWGPAALSDIADMLVTYLSEPERQADVAQLSKDLSTVTVPSDSQQLRSQPLLSILHYRISELSELDAFTQFFDDLRVLVINAETQEEKDEDVILLDSESIFGIFVRRCVLAFEQLEFHQTGTFHRTCMAAIESSEQAAGMSSALELQDLVAHQTRLLEGETGIVVPHDMKQQIRNLLGALPGYANTHYLDYLRLAHAGEYEQSEASLRRFFDSSAMEQHKHGFQYALLYLAVVRTRLGLVGEAQQALNEAMQIARDFQDHT
ncbi:APC5 protein, partial [Linderina macrospora]